jgi:pSer/pThr/pTyr-binding forkhead associated (FHA) protein
MDDKRTVDSKSRRVAPNHFVIRLHPKDHDELTDFIGPLESELVEAAKEYAKEEGYHLRGPITVSITSDESLKSGRIGIDSKVRTSESPVNGGSLVVAGGKVVKIGEQPIVIGRQPDCDIVFDDPNISRRHAEIRVAAGEFTVSDLGSTNGTKVNGVAVTIARALRDGDIVTLGNNSIRFEAK